MIVKNEAELLARCLASIRPVADQIVVVDTGSTDATIEVARGAGAEVVSDPWRNDFSWSRNVSLERATGQWILWLDADDVVPSESLPKLAALKKKPPENILGFIVRNQRPDGTGTEFVQARMFPNRYDIFFERPVHEQMMPSALRLGFHLEPSDVVVEHHGYADPAMLRKKAQRNIELLLAEYDTALPDPVSAVEIADSYQLVEQWDNAVDWYSKVLKMPGCEAEFPAIASQAHRGLGDVYNRLSRFENAAKHFERSLRLAPWRTDALYLLAVAQEQLGDLDQAIASLRSIRGIQPVPGQVGVNFREVAIKAELRLMRILSERDRTEEAVGDAAAAASAHPERPEVALMAAKVFLKAGKIVEALKLFEKSITLTTHLNIDSYVGLCLIYRQAGRLETVASTLEAIRPLFGTHDRYRAVRRLFLEEGDSRDADDALELEITMIRRDFFGLL